MARTEIAAEASLDTTKFQRGLAKADKGVKKFAKSSIASFARMGSAFLGIALVKNIAMLGTAAAETASKFRAVFGPATDEMNDKVQKLRETIPSTTAEMQDALATFASMANAFGLNSKAANQFSVEMVKIAGDIASFHNLPIEEAFTKIRSAISGEFEPMKQLGVVINEARLKQEGLNSAIWDGAGQMSAAQKALAVQSILIRDLGDANGDAAATANSTANQIKFLRKELTETGTEIGTTILPALAKLTQWTADFLSGTKKATEAFGAFVGKLAFTGGMSMEAFEAKMQLQSEGAFEGLSGRGGTKTAQRLIADRVKLIESQRAAQEKAASEKSREDEDAIKNASDLESELQKQSDAETDPKRKAALKDRLDSYREILQMAGKLSSMTGAKSTSANASSKDGPMGLNIERGEFESRSSFLKRREQARVAQLQLNQAKQSIAAGAEGFDVSKLNALKQTALGISASGDPYKKNMETLTRQMAGSMQTIEREMAE